MTIASVLVAACNCSIWPFQTFPSRTLPIFTDSEHIDVKKLCWLTLGTFISLLYKPLLIVRSHAILSCNFFANFIQIFLYRLIICLYFLVFCRVALPIARQAHLSFTLYLERVSWSSFLSSDITQISRSPRLKYVKFNPRNNLSSDSVHLLCSLGE